MKKIIALLLLLINLGFISCSAQLKNRVKTNNYKLISTFRSKNNYPTISFISNEKDLKEMYRSIIDPYKKSLPRTIIDFNENKIALIKKENIDAYNIDSISVYKNQYEINLSKIKNYNLNDNSTNLLMISIPKGIEKIIIKTAK
ncbi:hypothetical protein [Chishuiella sp.]|uniref:hypothetical protein n=1 Tax=Chishuiella sp. TaxID=1969467 RepID=UPI0028B0A5BE|nr:hypothetical protein [Chishuiella sp.]